MRIRKLLPLACLTVLILALALFDLLSPTPQVVLPALAAADVPPRYVEALTWYMAGTDRSPIGQYFNRNLVWRSVDPANSVAFCTALRVWENTYPASPSVGSPYTVNERPDQEVVYGVVLDATHGGWFGIADYVPAGLTISEFMGSSPLLGAATDARIARIVLVTSDDAQVEIKPKDGFWYADSIWGRDTASVAVTAFDSRGKELYYFVSRNHFVGP